MTIQGHIENGRVVLEGAVGLPEGTKVTVVVPGAAEECASPERLPSLYERLQSVAGKAKGLPTDLALNHDHYLHGQPKRHV